MIESPILYIVLSIVVILFLVSYLFNWGIMDILSTATVSFVCAYLSVFMYDWSVSKYVCNGVCYPYY